MYPYDKNNLLRKVAERVLVPIFLKTRLSANQITLLNFFVGSLSVIYLFAIGYDFYGWLLAVLVAMVDYVDGTIARSGRGHPRGQFLDTSLDWLYLMLLIGAISYHHNIMIVGYLTLVAITFANWVQYNGDVNIRIPYLLNTEILLTIGVLTNKLKYIIIFMMFYQWIRVAIMYRRSIWGKYKV